MRPSVQLTAEQFLRWQVHGVVECVFEVLLCAAPVWLVWNLQTGLENKTEVVLPFALRLMYVPITFSNTDRPINRDAQPHCLHWPAPR